MTTPLPDHGVAARKKLLSTRRRLIGWGGVFGTVTVAVILALVVLAFSTDRQGWNDESQVVKTRAVVIEEQRADRGRCKGTDFDTLVEWTQGDEMRSAWTGTCRSGPDVGDEVDLWVRDDGEITLTEPATTMVFIWVGVLFFAGLGVLTFFFVRSNLRRVNAQLTSSRTTRS